MTCPPARQSPRGGPSFEHASPNTTAVELLAQGPAKPPVIPHRGPTPRLPAWIRPFAVRGHLSYVRLGMEILRANDSAFLLRRTVRWVA
jgi:hypothetical protein